MPADEASESARTKVDDRVLRARLDRTRSVLAAAAGGMVEQAWDVSLRRAAQDMLALRIEVTSCKLRKLSLTEFLEMPGTRSLICILDGPSEAMGVIVLSPEVLAGLVEVQTLGTVTAHPPISRKPTRTDAAMVASFIDGALTELDIALTGKPEGIWAAGFRYASFLDDPRPLALMLEDALWQVADAEVTLDAGAKSGRILLALPANGRGVAALANASKQATIEAQFSANLREQIGLATASLEAVLVRMQVDLSELIDLGVDDVLPLFGASLDTVQLETLDGQRVATARLGQARGMRALRITRLDSEEQTETPVDPVLASAQTQFVPHGQELVSTQLRPEPSDLDIEPASMSELVGGLMADIGDTEFPPMDETFDFNAVADS